jgi:flagellar biosynthetic protein FliR
LLRQLVASYKVAPIGGNLDPELFLGIMKSGALMFSAALIISLPAVVLLFLVNVLIGFMTRVAPQMNIYAIGFPITLTVGLIGITVTLPMLDQPLMALMERAIDMFLKR